MAEKIIWKKDNIKTKLPDLENLRINVRETYGFIEIKVPGGLGGNLKWEQVSEGDSLYKSTLLGRECELASIRYLRHVSLCDIIIIVKTRNRLHWRGIDE